MALLLLLKFSSQPLMMDCRIQSQLPARLGQICNQQFPNGKASEAGPVLIPVSRQVNFQLNSNRNFSDSFKSGVLEGQRFPFWMCIFQAFCNFLVTKPCPYCLSLLSHCKLKFLSVVCSSGESNAMSLPVLQDGFFFLCLLAGPPDLLGALV